ncbi:MAG: hypothetical protein HYV16_16855 [Gammaproteobacteria bacterium]|nr:hypothetical protein [Gammaproteobacteria bacterium]
MLQLVNGERLALSGGEYQWLRQACLERGMAPPRPTASRADLLQAVNRLPGARAGFLRRQLDADYEPGESG